MAIAAKTKKTPPAHVKKRQANHHKHSKQYKKTYWPYLPMLLIVGLGFGLNMIWSSPGNVLGASSNYSSTTLLEASNTRRAAANQQPLTLSTKLSNAAQQKAVDMVANNYWSHNSPQGKTPWTFIDASGYQYQAAGENLAYGFNDADEVITGWMNSEEHRENMLSSTYEQVGFGVAQAPNFLGKGPTTIIVAEYGQPVPAVANITFSVPEPAQVAGVKTNRDVEASNVSRIQMLTQGKAAWSALALSAIAGAAIALFIVRHGIRLKKLVLEGESFVIHHPWFDTAIVAVITAGILLIQTTGVIR